MKATKKKVVKKKAAPKKLWVVVNAHDFDIGGGVGVYDSIERANEAAEKYSHDNDESSIGVDEVELNAPMVGLYEIIEQPPPLEGRKVEIDGVEYVLRLK